MNEENPKEEDSSLDALLEGLPVAPLSSALEGLIVPRPRGGPGRKAVLPAVKLTYHRDLELEDIERYNSGEEPPPGERNPLTVLRYRHQNAARLIARGLKNVEVAVACGYHPGYIGMLQEDPAFQELVEFFRGGLDEEFKAAERALATLGMSAVEELQDRIDDPERREFLPTKELRQIAEMALERSVAPKKNNEPGGAAANTAPSVNLNLNFSEPPKVRKDIVVEGEVVEIGEISGES